MKEKSSKAGYGWIVTMAWRDGKASGKKLSLFMASIVLGIAAVVAIQSFGENLRENISLQSKALMGADFKIDTNKPPNTGVLKIIDSLGGADAAEISFSSMVAFSSGTTKLVMVRGIEETFPFYGQINATPAEAASQYQQQKGALVDATLMLQAGAEIGDTLKVGNSSLPIIGALNSVPGSTAIFSSVAPPVLIPYDLVDETGLIQTGSRVDYDFYFTADPERDLEQLEDVLDPLLDAQDADLDTHTATSERMGRRYENFGKFLNVIAFIALLLGCIGIASAIHIYIKEKLNAVALLKCLGASRRQSFSIYLLQIASIGLVGGIIGTLSGLILQQLFPIMLKGLLPLDVNMSISPQVVLMGIILGVVMSVLFALYPLISTLYVSPLETLRVQENGSKRSGRSRIIVIVAIFVFILSFAFWLLEDWRYSLGFVVAIIFTFSVLAGVANISMKAVKTYFPQRWNFPARQSLLNLFRPQNQTLVLVLAIGVGTFLISTLYFTKDILLAQAALDTESNSPNMILLDVQTAQQQEVIETITENELPVLNDIPIVTMRIHSLKGRNVNQLRKDTTSQVSSWVLQHEFRVTYRDSLIDSELLEEGEWIPLADPSTEVPISVSKDFAEDAEVNLGDEIAFNVQGVLLNTYVSSIRSVDWSRIQLNFSIVFPQGVLEQAPQFRVLTSKVDTDAASAALQKELVQKFPNISIIDLRQILRVIEDLLEKISWLINFMALFSIFTGIIVLLGAVRTSKFQRIKESVLLRTLGAQSKQILKIVALEYLYLGILGCFSGLLLSLVSSQLLAWLVFESAFLPSLIPILVLTPAIILLVVLIGVSSSRSVIKSPPLQVLRGIGH